MVDHAWQSACQPAVSRCVCGRCGYTCGVQALLDSLPYGRRQLVWSGGRVRQHGLGLLCRGAVSGSRLSCSTQRQGSTTLSAVVAYAFTDGDPKTYHDAVADAVASRCSWACIYCVLQLAQCRRHLAGVLGDFHAQTRETLPRHQQIRAPRSVQPHAASDNGMRLLETTSAQPRCAGQHLCELLLVHAPAGTRVDSVRQGACSCLPCAAAGSTAVCYLGLHSLGPITHYTACNPTIT
jgi:hypothetical protein